MISFPVTSFSSNVLSVQPPSSAPATGENICEANGIRTFPQVQEPTVCTFVPNVIPTPEIPQPTPGHFSTDQANSFWQKWLPGTRVTRCYGCN
mgnify:FL=1